jgi:hypothetical protein
VAPTPALSRHPSPKGGRGDESERRGALPFLPRLADRGPHTARRIEKTGSQQCRLARAPLAPYNVRRTFVEWDRIEFASPGKTVPNRPRPRGVPRYRLVWRGLLLLAALLTGLLAIGYRANAAPGANRSRLIVARAAGDALSQPAAYKSAATAGPWQLTVTDVATGDDANRMVANASSFNAAPADGLAYVAVKISAKNDGTETERIDQNDFGIAGSSGVVRRFLDAIPPDPALDGDVKPGDSLEGWIVGAAATDDKELVLVYDSTTLTGNWADATLSLARDAAIPAVTGRAVKANKIGRDPKDPAGLNTKVATRDWVIELTDVVTGSDVVNLFPADDYRTTALEGANPGSSATWVAIKFTITNNTIGDQPAYFPATAFALAGDDGNPVPDITILSPPAPDAAGYYAPGASRDGWVVFDAAGYDGALVRFLPYRTDSDPRYIAYDGSGATNTQPSFSGTLDVGTAVKTNEDAVNLRKSPSTSADVVDVLPLGTKLTVTGAPQTEEGYTWYPVKETDSGKQGYVAEQFLDVDQ